MREWIIGSRESRLAVIQSELVKDAIEKANPGICCRLLTMKTTGDKILDRPLASIGGKGLFVKELDRALADGRTDLSVHSLKDLPAETDAALPLVACLAREDPRDVLVLPAGAKEPDFSLPVGSSSRRRSLQLKELYPQAFCESVRGNVQTRLKKLDEGKYGALILAAAGLKRLGLEDRISRYFDPEEMIPAAGQGILAVQGRAGEDYRFLAPVSDPAAEAAALCERAFVRLAGGGCTSPAAAYAAVEKDTIRLLGLYYDEATGRCEKGSMTGPVSDPEGLGQALARRLMRGFCEERAVGRVFLVGAGPGDAGLLTLRGRELLEEADVVVYDQLVGGGVLAMIPPRTRTINVGKRAGSHPVSQEEINQILLLEAQAGRKVVRLKGGDPFLFGRGGEELELLARNRIPFEIVPGVTSGLAVPAYNGIPVTHRDFASSVHMITGHPREGKESDLDFEVLARVGGTLVFLMGLSSLGGICKHLIEAGMDPATPAAVLESGTCAGQRRVTATLATLKAESDRKGIKTPAIFVVGEVCSLAERFSWYEKLPLFGRKIILTRPRSQIAPMAKRLRALGAEVVELPAVRLEPVRDESRRTRVRECLDRLGEYDWIVFTSPGGVSIFFEWMAGERRDVRAMAGAKIAALGAGTARELQTRGFCADLVPPVYDGASLGRELARAAGRGAHILLARSQAGNRELPEELSRRPDLAVDDVAIYDTRLQDRAFPSLAREIDEGKIACAAFTSASTVRGFAAGVPGADLSKLRAACIGKQTAAEAARYGMEIHIAREATADSLCRLIEEMPGPGRG